MKTKSPYLNDGVEEGEDEDERRKRWMRTFAGLTTTIEELNKTEVNIHQQKMNTNKQRTRTTHNIRWDSGVGRPQIELESVRRLRHHFQRPDQTRKSLESNSREVQGNQNRSAPRKLLCRNQNWNRHYLRHGNWLVTTTAPSLLCPTTPNLLTSEGCR